jgi:adenine phosphoribosyltransferase
MDSVVGLLREHITWETQSKTDVYPLLEQRSVRKQIIDAFEQRVVEDVDRVVGIEATGFAFGAMLADRLDKGFIAVRRKHKWPFNDDKLVEASCSDYSDSTKTFAVRHGQIRDGERLLIVDDWIETGSQYKCVSELLERSGAEIAQGLVVVQECAVDESVTALASVE